MKIAIIGAGFGGMAAAFDLQKAGHQVTIFESADYVGGLASGFKEPHWDWSVEKFYHHWFQTDKPMLDLIHDLGWEDQVLFPRPMTVMYHDGQFYPFDSILKALLFPGLGFGLDKIRFGFVGLFLRLTNNWKALEKTTANSWMMKWAGKNVYEKMWKPLLIGKFGPYYQDVNMAWMWARIKARTTRLGTFQGGFQRFADMFAERLRMMGVEIRLQTRVKFIKREPTKGWLIDADRIEVIRQDIGHHLAESDGKDMSRSARRLFARPARIEIHGRGGDGAVAQATAFGAGLLLVQFTEGRGLSILGIGGTYEFCGVREFWRRSHCLCRRLSRRRS